MRLRSHRANRSRTAALLASLAVLTACGGSRDPIETLLKDLERAAEHRDAEEVVRHLASDFHGTGAIARAEVGPLLRRYFAAYETVNLDVYDVAIERGEGTARLRFRADLDGRPLRVGGLGGLLPPSAMYRFDLHLRLVEGRWLVAEAEWEEATLDPARGSS